MSVETTTRLEIPRHVYARPFGAEIVLLDFANGAYFGLDEVGAILWTAAEKCESVDDAVARVVAAFDVEHDTARRDLLSLAAELVAAGLLQTRVIRSKDE